MATVKEYLEVHHCHQESNKDCTWAEPGPSNWEIGIECPMAQTILPFYIHFITFANFHF
jgi:hypothetical protein